LQPGDNILARHRFFMGEVHNVVRRTLTDFTDNQPHKCRVGLARRRFIADEISESSRLS
jgi:hypothetical protein